MTTVRPLGNRIVVKRLKAEAKSPGGIIIPDIAKEKPAEGEVLAVGPGKVLSSGVRIEPRVKVGDRILFGKYSGTEARVGEEQHLFITEDEILGVYET